MEFPLQNVKTTRILSADAATLAERDLVEALQNPTTNAPVATINDTHHKALRIPVELFNIITKVTEQESTNIHDGGDRRWK